MSTLVHVGVRATNLEETIRFWRDALGLKVFSTMDGCYDLTDGYHNFRVFQHNGPERPPHVGGMLDYLHIGVRVPDLQRKLRIGVRQMDSQLYQMGSVEKNTIQIHLQTNRSR